MNFFQKPLFFLLLLAFVFQSTLAQAECAARSVVVLGDSLAPMIIDGASVRMKPLSCVDKIMRGDLVIFRTGAHGQPVIKIAKGVSGDYFSIQEGSIFVNGERLFTSTGVAYHLEKSHSNMLALYERQFNGIVPPDSYLVLGDNAAGALDSTRIGLIHRSDIIMVGLFSIIEQ